MVDALVLQSKYASSQYKWPAIQHMNYSKKVLKFMQEPFKKKEVIHWNEQEQDNYIMMAIETCI